MLAIEDSTNSAPTLPNSAVSSDSELGDEKSCKICYSADDSAGNDFVSPCRCSGSIKWVHTKCLLRWMECSSYVHQQACNMCRYEYRRYWRLKSLSDWCWPRLHVTLWDSVEIFLDVYSTTRLVLNTKALIRGTKSMAAHLFQFIIWRMFVCTNSRIRYYKALGTTLLGSMFELRIQNAIPGS